jgi:hypothetical protein
MTNTVEREAVKLTNKVGRPSINLEEKIHRLVNLNLQIAENELHQLKKSNEWRTQLANEAMALLTDVALRQVIKEAEAKAEKKAVQAVEESQSEHIADEAIILPDNYNPLSLTPEEVQKFRESFASRPCVDETH